jgi:solute carrier family 25 (adenine nucleotide translocator) protein 4/5/6/31
VRRPFQGGRTPSLWDRFLTANAVVVGASTLTYPLDVVRKRLVADTALPVRQYAGLWDCVAKIRRTEGLAGFYRCACVRGGRARARAGR